MESSKGNPLDDRDIAAVIERYRRRIGQYGVTFDSMRSGNKEKQLIRHYTHSLALRGERADVLDIGCGLGGFFQFLQAHHIACTYTGYDIVPEYIEACRSTFTEGCFELRNAFSDGIDRVYDTVVMSQVLNNRYTHSDNMKVMERMLEMAYRHTRVSVSIDMMSTYVDYQDPALYYYQPEEVFRVAKRIARRVILRHDFRPFEFCIQLYHDDADGFVT